MLEIFQSVGRDLFLQGLNNSHSGNLSIRMKDKLVITRRGSMLGRMNEKDIIVTSLEHHDANTPIASSEIGIHRAIYLNTPAMAIVHAHPPHAIALSLLENEFIIPIDAEGQYLLPKVPILSPSITIASKELEKSLPEILKNNKIAIIKGHGSFASGNSLEEALQWTSSLQHSCKIMCIARNFGV